MQLIDLANKDLWQLKFIHLTTKTENLEREKWTLFSKNRPTAIKNLQKTDEFIFNSWKILLNSYNELKKLAFDILSMFGSSYMHERTFSNMNLIKDKLRNHITDEKLKSWLKLRTSYTLNIIKLSKEMQAHRSH